MTSTKCTSRASAIPRKALASLILSAALPAILAAQVTAPDGHEVNFRYRSFTGTTPSWVSPLSAGGNISHTSGSSDIVVTNRGTGFENFQATDFDGSTEWVRGASAISTTDDNGIDSFAVQAWFKADSVAGTRTLFSNTESNRGFALKISNGRLQGIVRFLNGTASVEQIVALDAAQPDLVTGRWYYAVFHVKENTTDNRFDLSLYLNHAKVGSLGTASRWNGVYQSAEYPMIGAEPTAGVGTSSFFDGQIYAVVATNYAIYLDNYAKVKVVRDGSRYFGLPSYHDYLKSTNAGMDIRMHETATGYSAVAGTVVDRMVCPFLNDSYIPQGLAYDRTTNRFYVGMYWKADDGTTDTYPSIMAEITRAGALRRVFQLRTPSNGPSAMHASGVGVHNGFLYVPNGSSIYRYNLATAPTYTFNPDTFANPLGDQNPIVPVSYAPNTMGNTTNSNLDVNYDYNGDPIVWVSEFHETTTNKKLLGYRLNADGSLVTTPAFVFTLPVAKVQGVICYNATPTDFYFYLSTSYGDVPSTIYSCSYSRTGTTAQNLAAAFTGPAGFEDLATTGSEIWTVSESGAKYLQKKADGGNPWEDLYPNIFGMKLEPVPYVLNNDNGSPVYTETGAWATSGSAGYNGSNYRYATVGGANTAKWNIKVPLTGTYRLHAIYVAGTNRATGAKYNIATSTGTQTVTINQTTNNLVWVDLGAYTFNAGQGTVTLNATTSTGGSVVIADALRVTAEF